MKGNNIPTFRTFSGFEVILEFQQHIAIFFFFNFYWSIVALQYCVSFYCTAT